MMDDDGTRHYPQLRQSPTGLESDSIPLSVSATSARILSTGKYLVRGHRTTIHRSYL